MHRTPVIGRTFECAVIEIVGPMLSEPVNAATRQGVVGGLDSANVLLRHRLLPQPGGLQRLVAIKVVAGLDDKAVSEAVDDGERLRVWRVRALPDRSLTAAGSDSFQTS